MPDDSKGLPNTQLPEDTTPSSGKTKLLVVAVIAALVVGAGVFFEAIPFDFVINLFKMSTTP